MSALPRKADIVALSIDVRFALEADTPLRLVNVRLVPQTDMASRRSRCIRSPALLRLEVERPSSQRHEARFEFERGPLACRCQRCLVRRRREGDRGWRIDSTRAVVRLAYSPRARPHIPGPLLPRPPTAAPRWRRGRTTGDYARQRLGQAFPCLRQAAPRAPPGRPRRGSRRW